MATDLPPPVNHVFVDFENVHEIDLAIFGAKAVHFTLLLGPRQKKLEADLVEKLLEHAASVQLVRLTSDGKNALDFTLAYYVGRAVVLDPTGFYHIVAKDKGYDPLIEHLRNKHIKARRHDSFASLTFSVPAKLAASTPPPPPLPAVAPAPAKLMAPPKPKIQLPVLDETAIRVLTHLREHPKSRPARKPTLVRHLLTLLGNKKTEAGVLTVIETLRQAGHIVLNEKGVVTYHL